MTPAARGSCPAAEHSRAGGPPTITIVGEALTLNEWLRYRVTMGAVRLLPLDCDF